jgi:hypothetical protein
LRYVAKIGSIRLPFNEEISTSFLEILSWEKIKKAKLENSKWR